MTTMATRCQIIMGSTKATNRQCERRAVPGDHRCYRHGGEPAATCAAPTGTLRRRTRGGADMKSKGVSRPCDQCKTVRRCKMHIDRSITPPVLVYLCAPCERELGFRDVPTEKETAR